MQFILLISGLLTNAESWINNTRKDLEELEEPDSILLRKNLSSTENPSKCLMQLELGLFPVKYVIMQKLMNFCTLHCRKAILFLIGFFSAFLP